MEGVVATLIAAPILALTTAFLKSKRWQLLDRFWFVLRYLIFVSLLAVTLWLNAEDPDQTEVKSLLAFILSAWLFEAFLVRQAIYRHSRPYLRLLFNYSAICTSLYLFSSQFDKTEAMTAIEFLALNAIFEFVRATGRKEIVGNIRYEINKKISRRALKKILKANGIRDVEVNAIVSRSFLHVGAYADKTLIGLATLVWSGHGPAEVDHFLTFDATTDVDLPLMTKLEDEAKAAGVSEVQIANKVIRSKSGLEVKLFPKGYGREVCLVKQLRAEDVTVDPSGGSVKGVKDASEFSPMTDTQTISDPKVGERQSAADPPIHLGIGSHPRFHERRELRREPQEPVDPTPKEPQGSKRKIGEEVEQSTSVNRGSEDAPPIASTGINVNLENMGWKIIENRGHTVALVGHGTMAGLTPLGQDFKDTNWMCYRCFLPGPWNGNRCLSCGAWGDLD